MTTLAPFLALVRRTRLLDPLEEVPLARAARSGDPAAREHLVRANLPFVLRLAREYRGRGVPFEDLVAEGNLGLLEAASRFEPEHGTRFITYAMWWIRKRMLLAMEMQARLVRVPSATWACRRRHEPPAGTGAGSLRGTEPLPAVEFLPDEAATHAERDLVRREEVREMVAALPGLSTQERRVLHHRFGLEGARPLTLRETGQRLQVSRERVRQLERQAIARLRRTMRARGLRTALSSRV